MERNEKVITILDKFAEAVNARDQETCERMLAFCEGAAWALTMARGPEDEKAEETA